MYSGAIKEPDGSLRSWRTDDDELLAVIQKGYFNLSQDVNLLSEHIVPTAGRFLADICQRRGLESIDVDWILPHISSMFFQKPLREEMKGLGFHVPLEKWFTNLRYKGNTGAASIFIMLEELVRSGKLKKGHRVLCAIPESARFTFACLHLTVETEQ
jgi:3-oxoacyl-[acyl-carrier-protein] synthase-3